MCVGCLSYICQMRNDRIIGKVVPMYAMKAYGEVELRAPLILNAGTRPKWMVSFTCWPVWRRDKCPANGENQTTIPWVSSPLPSCSTDSALTALCITVLCSEFVKMCQEDMMACFIAVFRVLQVMCTNSRKPREKSATVVVFWQRFKPGTSLTKSRESNNYNLMPSTGPDTE